jgi:hypothetical protein
MATKLNKQLKREIEIDGKPYMVTLSPEGVKLTEKDKRLGKEVTWKELVSGHGELSNRATAAPQRAEWKRRRDAGGPARTAGAGARAPGRRKIALEDGRARAPPR